MSTAVPNTATASFPLLSAQAVMQAIAFGSPGLVALAPGTPYNANLSSIGPGGLQKLFIYFSPNDSTNTPLAGGSLTVNKTSSLGTSVEELNPGGMILAFDPTPVNGVKALSLSTSATEALVYLFFLG